MKKIWSLQFVQERSKETSDVAYEYSWEKDINIISSAQGTVPFVESGNEALELMTKTEQCFEADDDSIMISFEVAHVA